MSAEPMTRKGKPDLRYTRIKCVRCRKEKRPNAFVGGTVQGAVCRKCRAK